MKIAIKGDKLRGKEVIQILESLGGKNEDELKGICTTFYYINDKNEICDTCKKNFPPTYKLYTIEEFEKEFPFKIGDEVTIIGLPDFPKVITQMVWDCDEILYSFEGLNNTWFGAKSLKKFEMKKERNITLTLEKAKEWYKKGGELKEIALQAFTEKELKTTEYVDLGLPSGTLWANTNEDGYYSYQDAIDTFGKNNLPKLTDFAELYDYCKWKWNDKSKSMIVTGPNGKYIILSASGWYCGNDSKLINANYNGYYWSVTPNGCNAHFLRFYDNGDIEPSNCSHQNCRFSIRKIKKK